MVLAVQLVRNILWILKGFADGLDEKEKEMVKMRVLGLIN